MAQAPSATVAQAWINDGPHVLWHGAEAEVLLVREGRLQRAALDPKGVLGLPELPSLRVRPGGPGAPRVDFPAPDRLAAVSDIHGNLPGLRALLLAHGIIDTTNRWTFGQGHLVVVGDVMDRGAHVTEVLWLLRSLESQAAGQGGRVHMVMGNHESMVLKGDHRYVNSKYVELSKALLPRLDTIYGPDSELGRWLRLRPAMVRIGRTLFLHGGISPRLLAEAPSLRAVNERLAAVWRPGAAEEASQAILGAHGPLWYRGLIPGADAKLGDATTEHVEALLRAFGADRVVVGHSTLETVTAYHGGQVIGVDAGLKDGKAGALLLLERDKAFIGLADGGKQAL